MPELWFQSLPPDRKAEMVEEYRASLRRKFDLELAERDRAWREAACMGCVFALLGFQREARRSF